MVMNDTWIIEMCEKGDLVAPYNRGQVNPASYDLTLGNVIYDLEKQEYIKIVEPFTINPGMAILASTIERVTVPHNICATLYLKSSMARMGLDHALAGWIDCGFDGTLTMELHAHRPFTAAPGMRICQIVFWLMNAPAEKPYQGRYQGQVGPTIARPEGV